MVGGDSVPFLVMVFVQVCYAGMNISSKLAMDTGMNPLVLVAYRQIFATLAIAPFGYWMERQETAEIKKKSGIAKIAGTIARLSENFSAPYTSTTLMCFMASIECGAIGLFVEHNMSGWSLRNNMRLFASLYAGVLGSAVAFFLTSWSIQRKGPLYTSVFTPLLLIVVAIVSWALLREKLYVGTAVGSLLIICGLYSVLWGKNKEMKQGNKTIEDQISNASNPKIEENDEKNDLEMQPYDVQQYSNGNQVREEKLSQFL
ncbi:hypothetical protein FEM48_Zijuj02G0125800 [Ziziphus jujuba var. spinosa]|uniref:WAT1-related protein n=1 Tax=Ziziphus jujuba var. spinosa TaxID=714518 RepID=A0A978VVS0_ZIZJJ|nr:hypothetical protein FEM48_Zijuj02G0125800 [Ziziphus jujuba var. spinosa]